MPFSDLVGIFSSTFDGSQLMPSLLATLGAVWGLPLLIEPGDRFQLLKELADRSTTDKLGIALGAAIVVSVVFRILKRSLVRVYEGYLPSRRLLAPFTKLQRWRRNRLVHRRERLKELKKSRKLTDKEQADLNKYALRLDLRHARRDSAVMPTRLGNAFRAFEGYPNERYDFDGVALWPRIQPFLSETAQQNVTAAQSTVDLLLTSATLSFLAGVAVVLVERFEQSTVWLVSGFVVFGYLLYRAAVEASLSLGFAVRAGFDVGRQDFLKSMGYELPTTLAEERELWHHLTRFLVYNVPELPPRKPPAVPEPASHGPAKGFLDKLFGD